MKKSILTAALVSISVIFTNAQNNTSGHFYGLDAFKYYSYGNFGSARVQGMGGAFSALGGDISSSQINPAGLGFFNKSEFSITPIFVANQSQSNYIGNSQTRNSNGLNIGQVGVVFSNKGTGTRKKRTAWSINYQTLANFSNDFGFNGSNPRSSIADYFAEKAFLNGASVEDLRDGFNENTNMNQTDISMAYWSYLIDPFEDGYIANELSVPVVQRGNVSESGNLGQINLSYGANFDDKTYVGLGLGIQNLNYSQLTDLNEAFPNGNFFNEFTVGDELYVNGTGFNVTAGTIVKLTNDLRIGASIASPTTMRISETSNSWVQFSQKPGTFEEDYNSLSTVPNDFKYRITSPLKANVGISYFLPKKIGAINIEAEYMGYSMMGVKYKDDARWTDGQRRGIQDTFKDVVNIKAGGEVRAGVARFRAGLSYMVDPHRNPELFNSKNQLIGSVGAGVRNSRFFADAAYTRTSNMGSFTPYTLNNVSDYSSAALDNKRGVFAISVGTFF